MQRCGCNLVGMSLSSQDKMLSQKDSATLFQQLWLHLDTQNHSTTLLAMKTPPPPTPPAHPIMVTYLLLLNKSGHSHLSLMLLRRAVGPSSAQKSDLDSDVPKLPWPNSWHGWVSSCVGIFKQEWHQTNVGDWLFPWDGLSTCDGLSFQQSVYNPLGLFFPCHNFPSPRDDWFAMSLQQRHKLFWWWAGYWKNVCVISKLLWCAIFPCGRIYRFGQHPNFNHFFRLLS